MRRFLVFDVVLPALAGLAIAAIWISVLNLSESKLQDSIEQCRIGRAEAQAEVRRLRKELASHRDVFEALEGTN